MIRLTHTVTHTGTDRVGTSGLGGREAPVLPEQRLPECLKKEQTEL